MNEDAAPGREAFNLWRRLRPALISASVILPLGLALNYALNVALARVLTVAGYGLFAFAQSLAAILSLAAALGFSTAMMRLVSAYRANCESTLLRGLIQSSLRLVLLVSSLSAVVLLLLGTAFPSQQSGLFWAGILLVPFAVDVWRESSMRGLHRTATAILPRQVLLPALTLGLVWVLGLNNAFQVLLCFSIVLISLEVIGLWQLHNALGLTRDIEPVTRTREWLRTSLPMAGTSLMRLGMTRWDIIALGLIAGVEATGSYAAAARTALLASVVLRVVNLVVGPTLAELYHTGDITRFRKLVLRSAAGSAVLGAPLYLLVMLYPGWVLSLFGPEYAVAALPLQILATGQFVNLVTGPVALALSMSKYEIANVALSVAAGVLSIAALAFLVPPHGAIGAALAISVSIALLNLSTATLVWRAIFC